MVKRRASTERHESYAAFLYPSFFILAAFVVTMLVWNMLLSFMRFPGYGTGKWIGLKNYIDLLSERDFWDACLHSLYYVIPMAIISGALALLLAVAVFDAFKGVISEKLVPWVRGGFYLPQVIPIAITGTLWGWLLDGQQGVAASSSLVSNAFNLVLLSSSSCPGLLAWTWQRSKLQALMVLRGGSACVTSHSRRFCRKSSSCFLSPLLVASRCSHLLST